MALTVLHGPHRERKSDLPRCRFASASGRPVVVIVTGEARDEEMTERTVDTERRGPRRGRPRGIPGLREAVRELEGDAFAVLDS